MWAVFLPLAKRTISGLLGRDEVRRYLVDVLRSLAATTDNKLDDGAVDVVEALLFKKPEEA
jgi:hypothetical protein|tara:strand:+ start:567 stop:749 length:183 start_codon:yes stop_codon:yes gene_type:complete